MELSPLTKPAQLKLTAGFVESPYALLALPTVHTTPFLVTSRTTLAAAGVEYCAVSVGTKVTVRFCEPGTRIAPGAGA